MNPQNSNNPEQNTPKSNDLAADLIRSKLEKLYQKEPSAKEELVEIQHTKKALSKHQAYMEKLSKAGMSVSQIQTEWHKYYNELPDSEKHEVWREFYSESGQSAQAEIHKKAAVSAPKTVPRPTHTPSTKPKTARDPRTLADVKRNVLKNVSGKGKLSKKHHFQSLLFGLGAGFIVMLVLLFGFFNERFIAPLITPSKTVSSTPILIDPSGVSVTKESKIIIPKINVEIPVIYNLASIDEKAIQKALEGGVVHYSSTPNPGERGNVGIVGHSSNNILNHGKYKFAFVLLNRLEVGDTFTLTKDGKAYVYKIYEKKIVKPTDVSVLGNNDKIATATLITCDPPGTSLNRLIVVGEQITPDPTKNTESTAKPPSGKVQTLPGNSQSLWQRFKQWLID